MRIGDKKRAKFEKQNIKDGMCKGGIDYTSASLKILNVEILTPMVMGIKS